MISDLRDQAGNGRGGANALLLRLGESSLPDRVWLEGDRLLYDWDFETRPRRPQKRANYDNALRSFTKIRNADDVLRFALRYGPLGICEHDKPYTHNPPRSDPDDGTVSGCRPRGWEDFPAWDNIAPWLTCADRARELLLVAAHLRVGEVDDKDWIAIFGRPPISGRELWQWEKTFGKREGPAQKMKNARFMLGIEIDEWIKMGRVSPTFSWQGDEPEIRLLGSVFGMLAVQLAAAIADAPSFSQCDGCRRGYFRQKRRPQSGRRNFCEDCGRTVANRLGQRDFQARKKGQLE